MAQPDTPLFADALPQSISNKPNKSLVAKLNKVLNSSVSEVTRIKTALTALSDIPDLDETELRRNLRGSIEKREIEANLKFLEAYGKVVKELEVLETEVEQMNDACRDMKQRLDKAQTQTSLMMEQANTLHNQSSACATRILIVDSFLEKFTLSDEEIKILRSSSVSVNEGFFDALSHLQQVYNDCQLLLMTNHQQAGEQIMQSMTVYQEAAYEKLYRWTQHECRVAFGGDSIDVGKPIVKALNALKHRPVLFQTIMDEIAAVRRDAVARAFVTALTRGGPSSRPIELQAHDSLRYIGDMLAWVHQACASEKEMLEALFQTTTNKDSPSLSGSQYGESPRNGLVRDAIEDLMDCAMEGACRPLKSRMEQVLVLQHGAITSYRVANLVQFYTITISSLLRKNAALAVSLYEITEVAYQYFFKTLSAQAERVLQTAEPPSKELTVSPVVREMTLQLKEILASYDSSLIVATNSTGGFPEFNFGATLDAIIDPLLRTSELAVSGFTKIEHDIYLINCMQYIQSVMVPYSFTSKKRESITAQIEDLLNSVASEHYDSLLEQSGLAKIQDVLLDKDPKIPLSAVPEMDAESLTARMSKFDSFLVSISADVPAQLQRLSVSQHCRQVQEGAICILLDTYRRISKAIEDPKNGYDAPDRILPRTIEEMEAIFSFVL
ncbi:Golgi transport complex subunit 6 [Apophysomyces ossiformis]|uniref:Conserved oligomeric Golgi complex subunit 6 n=1 Tax=Apophysomyces ossiformis TaxID=679940 RepID=A0A8H7BW28_9FUNG|nr:Golgi transport complex subunit 6 [Apophysomyces ossiformis]